MPIQSNRKTEDPTKQSRIPLAILIDSTKIEVPKSADFQHQKSTFFKEGNVLKCICEMIVGLEGPCFHKNLRYRMGLIYPEKQWGTSVSKGE